MSQAKVPPWILWVLCGASLAIAAVLSLLHVGDPMIQWIVCGAAAALFASFGTLVAYHASVERRIRAAFRRGEYLLHWTYPAARDQAPVLAPADAYVGPDGALVGEQFTCWKSLTTRLLGAALLPGPPPVLEIVYELGGALADAVVAAPSGRRLIIPVPPGHEREAQRVAQVLTEIAMRGGHRAAPIANASRHP